MSNSESQNTPTADGGKQTPIEPSERKTGQGTSQDVRSGAEPDAPGSKNAKVAGDPNQGTEAR
ncbi:hypothetical protein I4641_07550 [Waterburya agarophytonicola K14]|uniref:Uncharacterized protein n=1 Tax=Waterburya agarophytonicola KI4 TaxID=2874699 RepID=A0A964FFE4_9CYAN|nr:hypothetical protein [Waterburya agarophytonicola]MCC0176831.1 hypothetical protein [Waterburya agarophytonicola KI4]